MFAALLSPFRRIQAYFERERLRIEKMNMLFQEGRRVRHVSSGRVYVVEAVVLGAVFLMSDRGRRLLIDLMTPGGTQRTEVADSWEAA